MVTTSAIERARPEDIDPELAWCRVRGSMDAQKGGNRDRIVPVVDIRCAFLLACAREHADCGGILLFRRKANFRRDLAATCERLSTCAGCRNACKATPTSGCASCATVAFGRCSPNDLRRTHAKWLRLAGVEPSHIAPIMGHADSRMVQRVYGKVKPMDLSALLTAQLSTVL